ncbi:MAG: helix-turn-helix domain-containing protein [Myxococcota bacterium]
MARQYDRHASERRLIDAVDRLIARDGIAGVGVNAIARESGVNKSLLYRYFGSLAGLYSAYIEEMDVWPGVEEILGEDIERFRGASDAQILSDVIPRYAQALRRRPRTLELLAAELVTRNELTIEFERIREGRSDEVFQRLGEIGIGNSAALTATVALLVGAVNYLVVRARSIRVFAGAQIQEDHFWGPQLAATIAQWLPPDPEEPGRPGSDTPRR